jgi:translation elongation factor Ts/ribosomal protein S2
MSETSEKTAIAAKIEEMVSIEALHANKIHLGHSASYRNPMMSSMIHAIRPGVCIINLVKTRHYLIKSLKFVEKIVSKGGTVLFVGTKPTARDTITELSQSCSMPYVNHRWLGGMLTNFKTVKQSISRLKKLTAMLEDGTIDKLTKKEALMKRREIDKLEKTLGGIKNLTRLPDALVVIDVGFEDIAVKEANKLGIPVVGVVDTNNDPRNIQFVIPGNDDAIRSIRHITELFAQTIKKATPQKRVTASEKGTESSQERKSPKKAAPVKNNAEQTSAPTQATATSDAKKISAADVKKLREATGFAMMECKKALVEAEGDFDKAHDLLAKSTKKKMQKKADRIAAEGIISLCAAQSFNSIIEINCETDFVARDQNFAHFKSLVEQAALKGPFNDVDSLLSQEIEGKTLAAHREEVVTKLGENISVRRISSMEKGDSVQAFYNHGGKMAAMVALAGGNEDIARDIAMHIAAMNPKYVDLNAVPQEEKEKQEEIFTAQIAEDKKPEEVKVKIVAGKLKKHFEAECLMEQTFIKNPDFTIEKFLKDSKAELKAYIRFEVGEGIEKVETDFAAEVMAQVKG